MQNKVAFLGIQYAKEHTKQAVEHIRIANEHIEKARQHNARAKMLTVLTIAARK